MLLGYHGREFLSDPRLSALERAYIWILGIPISGLRIRLRRILPEIVGEFHSIIDIGCGKGVFSFELARKFPRAEITSIDTDREQIEINNRIAKQHLGARVRFEVSDILQLESRDKFDLAVCIDNLEHIEADSDAVKKIYQCLRPGGLLVCHVPADTRIWIFRRLAPNFSVPGHVRPGYSPQSLREKLEGAGFQVTKLKMTYGYLETVSNNLSYLITGADQRRKLIYALIFPWLNLAAWLGRHQDPGMRGAGVLAIARRPE